jgi:type VI secretion system secreted protein Hcp
MAADIFLKIEGITGEAQDALHMDEIEIIGWSWSAQQDSRMLSGSGGGSPKATVHDMVLIHGIDRATPNLMTACLNGRHFQEAVLTLRKSGGAPLDYFRVVMADVVITRVQPYGNDGGHFEELHLSFGKIKQEYLMQHFRGGSAGMVTGAFDIKNNRQA